MAAGLGSRFGGAKQFFGLGPGGEVLADYSLYDAWRAGFSRAVFVVRPEHESVILERFVSRWKDRLEITTAHQRLDELPGGLKAPQGRTKPWGTAHAVWSARAKIDGPFAVINADDFYGRPAFEAISRALASSPEEGALIGYNLAETLSPSGTVARGVCKLDEKGDLAELIECRKVRRLNGRLIAEDQRQLSLSRATLVSMNFWGLPRRVPGLFDGFLAALARKLSTDSSRDETVDNPALTAELALPDAISDLIRQGRLRVRVLPEGTGWIGVTYREDAPAAAARLKALLEAGEYPANLI